MKNLLFLFSILLVAVSILSSCNQEKCMKEYIECRDSCYVKADAFREQWSTSISNCQNQFDAALQACRMLGTNDEFMTCYENANAALQECNAAAEAAYDQGMDEVVDCVTTCKTQFEECSK